MTLPEVRLLGLAGLPEIKAGDDLGRLIVEAARAADTALADGDLVIITQKIVSKMEGRVVVLAHVEPRAEAFTLAEELGFEPHHTEVILRETTRIVRKGAGVLVCETRHGFVCANAGVDRSNAGGEGLAVLLPVDPDGSAQRLRGRIRECGGVEVGVLISDTFGRPWREGAVNVAIGVGGLHAVQDYGFEVDPHGYVLHGSLVAAADELAAAGELVMGKLGRIPVAIVRGYSLGAPGSGRELIREAERDLFR